MKAEDVTDTKQMDFGFDSHGYGAIAKAAKSITEGMKVSFVVFKRPDKTDRLKLEFASRHYFSIVEIEDGNKAFRTNTNSDTDGEGSHSLIASWHGNNIVSDPVFICGVMVQFLTHKGSDYFVESVS